MLVHPPTKSLLLKLRDPMRVRELLPKSRLLDHPDYNLVVQHTLEAAKVLRNIGIHAPAPILSQYRWPGKYKPFDHQQVMAEFYTLHRRCFNLSEMGAAKTGATLWAADYLMETGRVRKALVLAPLSTVERVWKNDLFDILMHRKATVLYGSREARLAALEVDVDFYIMNHDGLGIKALTDAIHRRPDIDLVIVDEGSMFRNADTKKYKALTKMLRPDMRLWWLTGTPCPNAPTDAWAQARLVCPERVPKFFGAFKRATMMQISQFKWVPRSEAYSEAYAAMQPAVRFKKADCLDLPPMTFEDRQCQLTPEQRKAFTKMKNEMVAEAKTSTITAVNAADKLGKIRQILCGAIKDPLTEHYVELPHGPRFDVLLECVEQASAKVLVIVPFKGIIQALERELSQHYSVGVLNGDVPPKDRDRIISEFKHGKDPHILLCHPKVMAHGLNLTEADTLIFYAPIFSNDEFQQVVERFNRAGQTRKMTVIKMGAHPIEWELYKALDGKQVTQANILQLYAAVTEGLS